MNFNILNLLIIFTAIQGLIFGAVVLINKEYKTRTHHFLAAIVLAISLSNIYYWFLDTRIAYPLEWYKNLYVPWDLLILPFYYAFVTSYLNIKSSISKYLFYPFVIRFIAQIFIVLYQLILHNYFEIPKSIILILKRFDEYVTIAFILFIVFKLFQTIIHYERDNSEHNASEVRKTTKWLKQLLYGAIILCSVWFTMILLNDFIPDSLNFRQKYYFLWIGMSGLIYWLGYLGIYHIGIFNQRTKIRSDIRQQMQDEPKIKRINLNPNKFEEINQRITNERLYTDPLISLKSLGDMFDLSEGYLSQLINNHTETNFSTYINALRVEEAKRMLMNEDYKRYTIVTLSSEAGFNSKSAFYTAFKKHTGQSPSEYKRGNIS